MNITWKDFVDAKRMYVSKRAYVDRGEIIIRKDDGGFAVTIYNRRFGRGTPIILKPFKTEAEAMIKAHMIVENHKHDLFQFRSFKTLQNDVDGYKAVILYDSLHDFFTRRILKVTIPKGTVIHHPDYRPLSELKYRAQDAMIKYVVDDSSFVGYLSADDITDDDVILSAYCCSKVINHFLSTNDDYLRLHHDEFIEQVKDLGGVYSEGMSIHIPDFSWEDTECGEGFHYFLTYDDAKRYSYRFCGLINALNSVR